MPRSFKLSSSLTNFSSGIRFAFSSVTVSLKPVSTIPAAPAPIGKSKGAGVLPAHLAPALAILGIALPAARVLAPHAPPAYILPIPEARLAGLSLHKDSFPIKALLDSSAPAPTPAASKPKMPR